LKEQIIMTTRAAIALSVLAMVAPALAQTTLPADGIQYIGELTGSNVYVRSGPSSHAYPCTKLSAPTRITVVGAKDEWLKILPPDGTFSVVSRKYVTADEDGKFGTITGDNVLVRAGGDLKTSDFSMPQTRASSGERVQIIGQLDDQLGQWYQIVPPADAFFWISAEYVKMVEDSEVSAATTRPSPIPDVAEPPALKVVEMKPGDSLPEELTMKPTTRSAGATKATGEGEFAQWEAAEKLLHVEFAKPSDERDIAGLIARYESIKVSPGSSLKPYIEARLEFLNAALTYEEDIDQMKESAEQAAMKQKQYQQRLEGIKLQPASPSQREIHSVRGVIRPSYVYAGGVTAPRRFLVIDPSSKTVLAYAQSSDGSIDLQEYVGLYVGLRGDSSYGRGLKIDIVEVSGVDVLDEGVDIPPPPRPVVVPLESKDEAGAAKPETQPADDGGDNADVPEPDMSGDEPQEETKAETLPATGLRLDDSSDSESVLDKNEYE